MKKTTTFILLAIMILLVGCSVAPHSVEPPTIVGNWAWFNSEQVTCYADGICVNRNSRIVGEWRLDPQANQYVIKWYPEGCEDVLTLSVDGTTLDGTNDDGVHVFGNRVK